MSEVATATDDEFAGLSAKETINAMSDEKRKALKSWYFFDWANQAYALTVMTVIAPALMAALYNTATGTQSGDTFYAWVLTNGIPWWGYYLLHSWELRHILALKATLYSP